MEDAQNTSNRRLDSWKEIAAFFGRDERTVRRWERERSLPVHRLPGKPRGSVYAFADELSRWLKTPEILNDELPRTAAPVEPETETGESPPPCSISPSNTPALSKRVVENAQTSLRTPKFLIIAAAILVASVLVAFRLTYSRNTPADGSTQTTGRSSNDPANELYLKGRYEWSKRTPESLNKAADYFTQAIALDGHYARAYAGLADTYNLLREYTTMPDQEAYPRAIQAARKAVELDDSLSEAHRSLAFASFWWSWDFAGAEREFQRAIELNPSDPVAHHWFATSLLSLGRFSESLSEIERARQLDPTSTSILADRGFILFYAGRAGESIPLLKQIEAADPNFIQSHNYLANIALVRKDYSTYLIESRRTAELKQDQVRLQILDAGEKGFTRRGGPGLLEALREAEERYLEQGFGSGYELARILALSGRNQEAMRYLERELENHDPVVIGTLGDPCFNGLHSDPTFQKLISRIGLPQP